MPFTYPESLPATQTPLGRATRVSIAYFLDHVLPPLPSTVDPDEVLAKMQRAGKKAGRPITKAGRWWGFATDPARADRCEETSFVHFADMVRAVAKASASNGTNTPRKLLHNPRQGTWSHLRQDADLPDAYVVSHETSQQGAEWADVCVAGEYRKRNRDLDRDVVRARDFCSRSCADIWLVKNKDRIGRDLAHLLRDPRRRFAFGYTVEDTNLELWFCDRTQVLLCDPVDWLTASALSIRTPTILTIIQAHRSIVLIFASLLFAETHRLGWDSSVKAVLDDDGRRQ